MINEDRSRSSRKDHYVRGRSGGDLCRAHRREVPPGASLRTPVVERRTAPSRQAFFGVTLKTLADWRFGMCSPNSIVVVEPDGWVREVRAASTDALSGAPLHHRDSWNEFIPEFHEAHPGWSRARTPPKVNWMWFPAGRTGMAVLGVVLSTGQALPVPHLSSTSTQATRREQPKSSVPW